MRYICGQLLTFIFTLMKLYHIISGQYRRIGMSAAVAIGSAAAVPSLLAQATGIVADTDPLSPGYLQRASGMLATGNPLGTAGQLAACSDDYAGFSPEEKARWLADEGASLFQRGDADCVEILTLLADEFPTSPEAVRALLTLGDWYWYEGDWHQAIDYYGKTDISSLPEEERLLYSYRKAYAYLKCGIQEQAAPLFAVLSGRPGFERAARYYTAYILYLDRDYDKAYEMMKELASEQAGSSLFSSTAAGGRGRRNTEGRILKTAKTQHHESDGIEPLYYMAQMEYLRGEYPEVIEHTTALLAADPVEDLLPELHRVAGLSYFKTGDYDSARTHLSQFSKMVETPNDDALYALGVIQYADSDLSAAEKSFRPLVDRNNALAQGAYLYLGQIAERKGDMNAAAMAFGKASAMAFDAKVAETALFNHITALTKGGSIPFASSVTMLEDFLRQYPSSPYASDVKESLAAAYFYDHNYEKALAAIDGVKNPSGETLATKQKILYQLGMGEINAGALKKAAAHLGEAAAMKETDASLAAESRLWLAEALYREGDYKGAAAAYEGAMKGDLSSANRLTARYGLGYSRFKLGQWKEAQKDFAGVAENASAPATMKGDALIRDADCLLYIGEYSKAQTKYQRAAREGSGDADYAAFRHAVVSGLTEGTESKMKRLNAFLTERTDSKWTPEVLMEAGRTQASLDRPDKAAPYFERLTREYPKDNKSRSGALALALAYVKQGDNAKAQDAYREIIRTWPTSEEAALANEDMRRLCAADGSLIEYAKFLASIEGAPQIDPDEMDAITFDAAETAYADNQENTRLLEEYIAAYPNGRYLANALMNLAEAADMQGDSSKTLIYLDRLLESRGDSPQTPAALFMKADILEHAGNIEKALEAYLDLEQRGGADFAPEATAGVMRTTGDAGKRTAYARRLLSMGGVSADDAEEARYYEASGLLYGSDPAAGEKSLRQLAGTPNSLCGARAAVELGDWYLANGDTKNALTVLEAFTDAGSIHAYWLARGFISLADAYHADGNDYLATEYLKSLRDNYPGGEEDIADAIESKIKEYSK